jgi:hypothetical protein
MPSSSGGVPHCVEPRHSTIDERPQPPTYPQNHATAGLASLSSAPSVVRDVVTQDRPAMPLLQDDDIVQTLAAGQPNHGSEAGIPPGRVGCSPDRPGAERVERSSVTRHLQTPRWHSYRPAAPFLVKQGNREVRYPVVPLVPEQEKSR